MELLSVVIGRTAENTVVAVTTASETRPDGWRLTCTEPSDVEVAAAVPDLDPEEADDRHLHFVLPDFEPGSTCRYTITFDGEPVSLRAPRHEGERAPATGTFIVPGRHSQPVRFALGGDQEAFRVRASNLDNSRTTTRIYEDIAAQKPAFFVQLGDIFLREPAWRYVPRLGDLLKSKPPSMKSLRKGLERDFHEIVGGNLRDVPAFRLLDDHDFRFNGLGAALRSHGDPAGREKHIARQQLAVQRGAAAFQEFWPMGGPDAGKGLYYAFASGPCAFIGLNARAFADPHDTSASRRLLGEAQTEWLERALDEAAAWAQFTFILSPLPFAFGKAASEDFRGASQRWTELLRLFVNKRVSGIFTADSHNYSRGHIEVDGHVLPQFLIGTLGGRPQHNPAEFWRGAVDFDTTASERLVDVPTPGITTDARSYYSARYSTGRPRFGHALVDVDPVAGSYRVQQFLRHAHGHTAVYDDATYTVRDGLVTEYTEAFDMARTLPPRTERYRAVADIPLAGLRPTGLAWHPGRDTLMVTSDTGDVCEVAVEDGTILSQSPLRHDDGTPRNLQGIAVRADGVIVVLSAEGTLVCLSDGLEPISEHRIVTPFTVDGAEHATRADQRFEGLCVDADGTLVVTSRSGDERSKRGRAVMYGLALGDQGIATVMWRREVADERLGDIERVEGGYWAVSGTVLAELDETWGEPQLIDLPTREPVDGITIDRDGLAYLALAGEGLVRSVQRV